MKVLNLYAGIGGNRKLWKDVEVTAIELDPKIAKIYQANFPEDKVIVTDAHAYLLKHYKKFDFIWSSPVCKSHSKARFWGSKGDLYEPIYIDFMLYQEIIFLRHFCDKKWCVENVRPFYKPIIRQSFSIGRHLYWSNFSVTYIEDNHDSGEHEEQTEIERNTLNPIIGNHILNCSKELNLYE